MLAADFCIQRKPAMLSGLPTFIPILAVTILTLKAYALARGLDKAFKDANAFVSDMSRDETKYIAYIEADNQVPTYYYGDRTKKKLDYLFSQYPEADKLSLAHHEKLSYTTRDEQRH